MSKVNSFDAAHFLKKEAKTIPTIRGRIGQYKVLSQERGLSAHLVPTIRLSKTSLLSLLSQHDAVVLKPVVGTRFITICREKNVFIVTANEKRHDAPNVEATYDIVQQNIENQNYVIQPLNRKPRFWQKQFHRYITIQKNGANWEVTSSTKQVKRFAESLLYKIYASKIREIARLAAKNLHIAYPNCEAIVLEISVNAVGHISIHDSYLHFSVSKWNQYQSIKSYMPATDLLTTATLQHFLKAYRTVYLKPCNGQQGRGIIKISRENGGYELHRGRTKQRKQSIAEVMNDSQINECYIIQQGIPLAKIQSSVFDVRVLLKKVNGHWQVKGKVVKVAGDEYIVTNAAKEVLRMNVAIKQSTIYIKYHDELGARLDVLCTAVAIALDRSQERTIIGFDVGVTEHGELRIIEGNYMPDLSMFHQARSVKQPSEP